MRWTLGIGQKMKTAILLGLVMCLVVVSNLILQKNISDINESVNSIYNDRLIPATDIYYLSENLHGRQMALEKFLMKGSQDIKQLRMRLNQYDDKMSKLMSKYEKTYLVTEEKRFLKEFKKNVRSYASIEAAVLALGSTGQNSQAAKLYENAGRGLLESTISQLSELASIQSNVGDELLKEANGIVTTSKFLSDLQLILSIIIGLMITALILTSKAITKSFANYNLN